MTNNEQISAEPTHRSYRKRWLLLTIFALTALLLHRWWLPLIAYPIARCDAQPVITASNDELPNYLLFTRSSKTTLPAFAFGRDFALIDPSKQILILAGQADRAEQIGAEPAFDETVVQRFLDMGVPQRQLKVVGSRTELTTEEAFEEAKRWLAENPSQQLLLPTHRFAGGLHCDVAATILSLEERERIRIIGLPRQGVEETTWWKNSGGLKSLLYEYLTLLHYRCYGEPRPKIGWDPDEYEQQLAKPPQLAEPHTNPPTPVRESREQLEASP